MNKRGISAIVATVLVVLIVVVTITITWVAVEPLISSVDISDVDSKVEVITSRGYTVCDASNNEVLVQIRQKGDGGDISKIKIILGFDGESYGDIFDAPGTGRTKTYNFSVSSFGKCPDSVGVVPILESGKEGKVGGKVSVPDGDLGNLPEGNLPDFGSDCEGSETQPCGNDVGECTIGVQNCVDGHWGACSGIASSPEICFGGLDEDCDNKIDGLDSNCTSYYVLQNISGNIYPLGPSNHDDTMSGYKFSPVVDVYLKELCKYPLDDREVRVYNSSYDIIASENVTGDEAVWNCTFLNVPILLSSLEDYFVVAYREINVPGYVFGPNPSLPVIANNINVSTGVKDTAGNMANRIFTASHYETPDNIYGIVDIGVVPI